VTAPVKVDGARLLLNVDTVAPGELRAALLDDGGKPIEGFGADDCDALRINSSGAEVTWKKRADLSALRGREVRVQFIGARTKLYGFRFESKP
jgi:hypothetical protein